MCGIAGYSVQSRSSLDRTLAAQALLAAIAERGADAVGYAYRRPDDAYATVVKQRTGRGEDDRRLGSDLRARGALTERSAGARASSRRARHRLARRARAGRRVRGARQRPPALARRRPRRRLLRVDEARARDGRAVL